MEGEWREYACAYCGEVNETLIDPSSGARQSFVEDCAICCRPNVVHVHTDPSGSGFVIEAEMEE